MAAITYGMTGLPETPATGLATVIPQLRTRSNTIPVFLDVTPGGLVVNWSGYIHHSAALAAAAVGALVDPGMARTMTGEAWGMRLVKAVGITHKTDTGERAVLAALGGLLLPLDGGSYAGEFSRALFGLIERRGLERFFDRVDATGHYALVPQLDGLIGRAKGLSPVDRVILAVIVGLYRGDGWPEGFKRDWNPPAADAFARINDLWPTAPDDVRDFYSLLALYPGW